jgi:FKBP-type peptidyl-prolyl cis-trans isomerase SlyD
MHIEKDKVVYIRYKLYDEESTFLGETENNIPMGYIQGRGQIIAGLEAEMEGHKTGDTFSVHVPFEKAYGAYNNELLKKVDLDKFQSNEPLEEGMKVKLQTSEGDMIALVKEVGEEDFTLDLNHPLASVNLLFEVEVVEVRDATMQELERGHVQSSASQN